MITATQLSKLIADTEWLLEGLDKSLWQLIKLREPERWEYNIDKNTSFWVVALVGTKCIVFSEDTESFHFSEYLSYGCVQIVASKGFELRDILIYIQRSRFKVRL